MKKHYGVFRFDQPTIPSPLLPLLSLHFSLQLHVLSFSLFRFIFILSVFCLCVGLCTICEECLQKPEKVIEFLGGGVTDSFRTARPLLHRETLSQRTKTNKKLRIVKWGASRRGWGGETNQNALSEKNLFSIQTKNPKM